MLIFTGMMLVLVTWALLLGCFILLGLLPTRIIGMRKFSPDVLRSALWFGVLLTTLFVYLLNLKTGLHSAPALACFAALVALMGSAGLIVLRPRKQRLATAHRPLQWLLLLALAAAIVYLAIAALGPVTNYDSGLYHLGAIHYAGQFPTIPGLANLYFAFGYGNAEFPLAAFLGNGPWGEQGFRLLNGLVIALAVVDLFLRLRGRKPSFGSYVLIVGLVVSLIPMVALSDYWVTSPSQDSSVMMVTILAIAYLADSVAMRQNWVPNSAVALALCLLLVLLRPTMVAFGLIAFLVVLVLWFTRRQNTTSKSMGAASAVILVLIAISAIAAAARDYVLSGWLQYPLSLHAFQVPWRALEPTQARLATLGYHRDPSDLWNAATGWNWIGSWISRLPTQWETYEFVVLLIVAMVGFIIVTLRSRRISRWRALMLVLAPSVTAVLIWFIASPPSFRFIWGPLFMIPGTMIAWSIWQASDQLKISSFSLVRKISLLFIASSLSILAVVAYSFVARLDTASMKIEHEWKFGVSIPYVTSALVSAEVKARKMSENLTVVVPTQSDQCWNAYPLCTPDPAPGLALRGTSFPEGFLP